MSLEEAYDSPLSADDGDITPLMQIMARLRDPTLGCEWDRQQTFASIAPYTIEEAYEVADAIARGDMAALADELGDLLLQVVFHAHMAQEAGQFTLRDVVAGICAKMERRHPHIFGGLDHSPGWESIKARERLAQGDDPSALAGVAVALPALLRAEKIQNRAARVGFDWPSIAPVVAKVSEELDEVAAAVTSDERDEEIGDLLFAVVNLARHHGVDAEHALGRANRKFEGRFRNMEAMAPSPFATLSLDEQEALWQAVKDTEKSAKANRSA
jgi:nucleoside triphosphate diphosphatase